MSTFLKYGFLVAAIALSPCVAVAQQDGEQQKESNDSAFSASIANFTKRKIDAQKYVLNYKFKKGDVIRWQHDHRTVVETRFGQDSEKTSTRARPDYKWTVKNVDSLGNIRFDIEMERIKVLEQHGEEEPILYDSEKHKDAPDSCLAYQERLGRVCSTYSVSPNGQVVGSKSHYYQVKLGGVGENPVIAFPNKPIGIGHKWDVTDIVRAKDEYGVIQQVKLRVRYVLEKVVDGKAHITFTTDTLNPQIDETVRSQIVTHLTRGFVVFDVAKGVLTNRETRWDERVIGYQGPESYMHYQAFRKESLAAEEKVAVEKKPAAKPAAKLAVLETEEEKQTQTMLAPLKK